MKIYLGILIVAVWSVINAVVFNDLTHFKCLKFRVWFEKWKNKKEGMNNVNDVRNCIAVCMP